MNPNIIPSNGPPIENLAKSVKLPVRVYLFPLTKSRKRVKKIITVPLLSKDSPSIRVLNLSEALNYLSKLTIATGSVAERIVPNVIA